MLRNFHFFAALSFVTSFSTQNYITKGNLREHSAVLHSSGTLKNDDVTADMTYEIKKSSHPLSPPVPLQILPLHKSVAPIQTMPDLIITRISNDPDVFLLEHESSTEDQISLINQALSQGMEYAGTSAGNAVKQRINSYTAWINTDEEEEGEENAAFGVARYMTKLSALLFVPEHVKDSPLDEVKVRFCAEPLQIVRYDTRGKYDVHHDGFNRFLTVLSYLNGVAGTWFPFALVESAAKGQSIDEEDEIPDMTSGDVAQDKTPGKDGLLVVGINDEHHEPSKHVVRVKPGDAIVFYNYDWIDNYSQDSDDEIPPTGPIMNWRSIHSGMETDQEKWIATNWFHFNM